MIITIGEDVDVLWNDPQWRQAVAASEDLWRVTDDASDIEIQRLRRVDASYADRLLRRLKDAASRVASVARRVRAARSVRATRRAKAAAKVPAPDAEPPAVIVHDLVYADDLEPFVRIMGRVIAINILSD